MPVEDLIKCVKSVLYIGSSVPLETSEGLDAIQQPLKEHYPVDEGATIDGMKSTLTVLPTGLQLMLCDDDSGTIIWFPITSLSLCAAVRCINTINTSTGEKVAKFVSLSSPAAGGMNCRRPAIFTAITRRTKGKKVLECHGFVCESAQDALELVQKTSFADRMCKKRLNGTVVQQSPTYGIENLSTSFVKSPDTNTIRTTATNQDYPVRLIAGEGRPVSTNGVAPEFLDNPPEHGYFYSTKNSKVKKFTVDPVSDVEVDYFNSSASPPPFMSRVPGDRRSVVSQPVGVSAMPPGASMTLPHPRGPPVIIGRPMPPPPPTVIGPPPPVIRRGRFFSPPPPQLVRPRMMPAMPRQDPHVFMPPHPVYIDAPYVIKRRPRRPGSHSSGSGSGSSRSSSPRNVHDETFPKRNMDNGDLSSELSSRPRTPPTDYEARPRGPRISRREEYDLRHRVPFGPVPVNGFPPPPPGYYMYGPGPQRFMPMYIERARSVPPPDSKGKGRKEKKAKNKKKDKKGKKRVYGVPSDSTDSYSGYMSENPNLLDRSFPRVPKDFRKSQNMNMSERAFSKNLEAQRRLSTHDDHGTSAYALNDRMASRGRGEEDFHMY